MKKLIFLFALLLAQFNLSAQILEPIKWTFKAVEKGDEVVLNFKATIDGGWHLYDRNLPADGPVSTEFIFENEDAFEKIGDMTTSPKAIDKHDATFDMQLRYFEKEVTFSQRVKIKDANIKSIAGYVTFMCCDDEQCLPPTDVDFNFAVSAPKAKPAAEEKLTKAPATAAVVATKAPIAASTTSAKIEDTPKEKPTTKEEASEPKEEATAAQVKESITAQKLVPAQQVEPTSSKAAIAPEEAKKETSLWSFFVLSFLGGLLAIVTPCVFPMIPMTVSFFMHSGKSKAQSRMHAIFYGFSIIAIYTIIGTLVAVFLGPEVANWLSTHWLPNTIFFTVFIVFAFSFFGMFEITLPSSLVNKSDQGVDKGGFLGAFFMALTLVLVSFSCTGPIVGAILVESAGGAVLKPITGMLGFSLAFALPFTLFAFFPSWLSNLPKSGGWLNSVKVVLGFLELALGLKFLSIADQTYHWGILDREVYLALWIVIFALMGFYLLGKLKFAHDSDLKYVTVPRLVLAIATFSFVVYMVPGMFGAPLKAISGYMPPMHSHDFNLREVVREEIKLSPNVAAGSGTARIQEEIKYGDFLHLPHGLDGFFDYEQGMAFAKEQGKPVFIDFTGHGCVNCREMEAAVWSDPRVLKILKEEYVIIALYVDDKTDLPEEEWVTSTYDGKVKKTLGKKYADFQIACYNVNAQPYYVLLDNEGKKLTLPKAYDLDPNNFVTFLEDGLSAYKKR
ncbi:MAG: cytochrome c biogenesis protein CcdA [Bacteroidales bacterium]